MMCVLWCVIKNRSVLLSLCVHRWSTSHLLPVLCPRQPLPAPTLPSPNPSPPSPHPPAPTHHPPRLPPHIHSPPTPHPLPTHYPHTLPPTPHAPHPLPTHSPWTSRTRPPAPHTPHPFSTSSPPLPHPPHCLPLPDPMWLMHYIIHILYFYLWMSKWIDIWHACITTINNANNSAMKVLSPTLISKDDLLCDDYVRHGNHDVYAVDKWLSWRQWRSLWCPSLCVTDFSLCATGGSAYPRRFSQQMWCWQLCRTSPRAWSSTRG